MSWFFKHKFLTLLIIAVVFYWFYNPPGRFGMHTKGFIVYNKIPLMQMDCYIDTKGKMHLESDLSEPQYVNYWYRNHFIYDMNNAPAMIPLIIGTGYEQNKIKKFGRGLLSKIRQRKFEPKFYPTPRAIEEYNKLRDADKQCAILLKIK
jgi:hypothetical protein